MNPSMLSLPVALSWRPLTLADLERVVEVEQRAYSHPWTRGNFVDSLAARHWAWCGLSAEQQLVAYWWAMPALDELHLLNLTVDPEHQGQGHGRRALQQLHATADAADMGDVWLEVRATNARAQALYLSQGYAVVGRRRDYYPAGPLGREDALLMRRGAMRHD